MDVYYTNIVSLNSAKCWYGKDQFMASRGAKIAVRMGMGREASIASWAAIRHLKACGRLTFLNCIACVQPKHADTVAIRTWSIQCT